MNKSELKAIRDKETVYWPWIKQQKRKTSGVYHEEHPLRGGNNLLNFQMLVRDAIIFNGSTASPACFPSFLVGYLIFIHIVDHY